MFAQQVDTKLLARLGESEHAVQRDDIGEDATSLVVVDHVEKLERHLSPGTFQHSILGLWVEIVYALVLVMQGLVEQLAAEAGPLEHTPDESLELDVAVVHLIWHRALQLDLVCLEATVSTVSVFDPLELLHALLVIGFGSCDPANHGRVVYPPKVVDRVHLAHLLLCLAQNLNRQDQPCVQIVRLVDQAETRPQGIGLEVGARLAHFVSLLLDGEVLVDRTRLHLHLS